MKYRILLVMLATVRYPCLVWAELPGDLVETGVGSIAKADGRPSSFHDTNLL